MTDDEPSEVQLPLATTIDAQGRVWLSNILTGGGRYEADIDLHPSHCHCPDCLDLL